MNPGGPHYILLKEGISKFVQDLLGASHPPPRGMRAGGALALQGRGLEGAVGKGVPGWGKGGSKEFETGPIQWQQRFD